MPDDIIHAIQEMEGRLNTSLKETVNATVKETVNGKIDKIDKKLDAQNVRFDAHVKTMEPVIEGLAFLKTGSTVFKYVGGSILTFAAVWVIIRSWFRM